MKAYAQGVRDTKIIHQCGRSNVNADALSRNPQPQQEPPSQEEEEMESGVSVVCSTDIETLLETESLESSAPDLSTRHEFLPSKQHKDPKLREMITFLKQGDIPKDDKQAHKLVLQQSLFTILDNELYKVDPKKRSKHVVVPQ